MAFRSLLATTIVAIFYLATARTSIPVVEHISDKIEHAFAFLTLAMLADFSWPESGFGSRKILVLLGYGLAIEIVQYFLPYRTFSLLDLTADAVGLFLYWLAMPLVRRVPLLSRRWEGRKAEG